MQISLFLLKLLLKLTRWLAHVLQGKGVGPDDLVGLCLKRSPELIIGILGILKSGGAYVPLDPNSPSERLASMMEQARLTLLLTQEDLESRLPVGGPPRLVLDLQSSLLAQYHAQPLENRSTPQNLAYVIYTSGSTGQPKGVEIAHQGVLNSVWELVRLFQIRRGMNFMQWANVSFDASVWDVIIALLTGGTLHLTPPDTLMLGEELMPFVLERDIEILALTPSALATLPVRELPQVQTIVVAGETCSAELVHAWVTGRRFYNIYGMTEATIWSTFALCNVKQERVPVGRPIANTQVYVLDQWLQPVPVGIPGELYIGGVGLARGYCQQPDLTADRFIPHPFSQIPGERLYRSGDLVRYLPDGTLDFLGRIDQQVKIRGYRVELEEIKQALDRHPSVCSCLIQAKEVEEHDLRIIAYLTLDGTVLSHDELDTYLKQQLPQYMVPSHFIILDKFPLTPNRKIDTNALPLPAYGHSRQDRTPMAPRSHTEKILAVLWQNVLGVADISIHDDFFALGGHSLLVAHLATEIQDQFDLLLPLATVMENSTLEALAAMIDNQQVSGDGGGWQ